jgi:hypothetical protein
MNKLPNLGTIEKQTSDKIVTQRRINSKRLSKLVESGKIHIPHIQRELSEEKIESLRSYLDEYDHNIHYFQFHTRPIQIGLLNDCLYLVDGQHRARMYSSLSASGSDYNISIVVRKFETMRELEMFYRQLNLENSNLTYPVDELLQAENERKYYYILNEFRRKYSSRCFSKKETKYKYTLDTFIKHLQDIDIYQRYGLETPKEAVKFLNDRINDFYDAALYEKRIEQDEEIFFYKSEMVNINEKCIFVLKRNNFLEYLDDPTTRPYHNAKCRRTKIPKALKMKVWEKAKARNGKCLICNDGITKETFECGHVLPVSRGGKNRLDNLEPICGECNRNMSDTHMDDFIEEMRKLTNDYSQDLKNEVLE